MIELLSTQSFLDILAGHESIEQWRKAAPLHSVELSAVSIGQALAAFPSIKNQARQRSFEHALDGFVSAMQIHQGIVPFDEGAARLWAMLLPMALPYQPPQGALTALSVASRMVVATALSRNANLVEATQPYHSLLPGLSVTSP
jgi:hypothetical protein